MCMCPLILSVEAANGFMQGFTVLQPLQDLSTVKKQEFAVLKDAPFFFYYEMHLSCGHCDKNMTILMNSEGQLSNCKKLNKSVIYTFVQTYIRFERTFTVL